MCTDIVVTARPINASGTQFMFDINLVGYTFDMGDMVFDDEPTLSDTQSRQSDTPDRSDYARIPKISKYDYGDSDWYNPKNAVIFFDNTVFSLINSLIDLANGPIISSQIGYHEGVDAWWDNEKKGAKALVNAPINYAKSTYNYATTTPFSKQMSDLGRDLSNPHQWEDGVAMALSLYGGGYGMASKAGIAGKSSRMLGEPNITLVRGINTDAGMAYQSGLSGLVKPRGGLFGHSDPLLHNSGFNGTLNSRLTSWTTNSDVAMNFALRTSGQGIILKITVPISKLIKSPNLKDVLLKHKGIRVSESEVLIKGKIKNAEVIQINQNTLGK